MKQLIKLSSIACCACLGLSLVGCSGGQEKASVETEKQKPAVSVVSADYPGYENLDSLMNAASEIVQATFDSSQESQLLPEKPDPADTTNPQHGVSVSEKEREAMGVPVTLSTMVVEKSLKGSLKPGQKFVLSQTGGTTKSGETVREISTALVPELVKTTKTTKFLLALKAQDNNTYTLLTPTMGFYALDDKEQLLVPQRDRKHPEQVKTTAADSSAVSLLR